jgi:NAD(P)-dependent dehydrogenase (short-subunit alcohol dehydrogenase family)
MRLALDPFSVSIDFPCWLDEPTAAGCQITEEAVRAFSRVDILVNDAAVFVLKGFDTTLEEWHWSLGVNVIGTALCTKYAVQEMKKHGGAIVNLGSISRFIAERVASLTAPQKPRFSR